jgi:hypothetical protein
MGPSASSKLTLIEANVRRIESLESHITLNSTHVKAITFFAATSAPQHTLWMYDILLL